MKLTFLLSVFAFSVIMSKGQSSDSYKSITYDGHTRTLSIQDLTKWPEVKDVNISNKGDFIFYTVTDLPGSEESINLKQTFGSWSRIFQNCRKASFSDDSKWFITKLKSDSLIMSYLPTKSSRAFANIKDFNLIGSFKNQQLVVKGTDSIVRISDLKHGISRLSLSNIIQWHFTEDRNKILMVQDNTKFDRNYQTIFVWNCQNNRLDTIWSGFKALLVSSGSRGTIVAVLAKEYVSGRCFDQLSMIDMHNSVVNVISIPIYKLIDTSVTKINRIVKVLNAEKIIFELESLPKSRNTDMASSVDIWSYLDVRLQSEQLVNLSVKPYLSVWDLQSQSLFRIDEQNERILARCKNSVYFLVRKSEGDNQLNPEANWNRRAQFVQYLVLGDKGRRFRLPDSISFNTFSKNRKYIIGEDIDRKNLYSFEIATGKIYNITHGIDIPIGDAGNDRPKTVKMRGFRLLKWLPGDKLLLMGDRFDIWAIDPTCKANAINLTEGFGRSRRIVFSIPPFYDDITNKDLNKLILSAYNTDSCTNGFYELSNRHLRKLTMGPFVHEHRSLEKGVAQVKAKDANIYIVLKESADKSPNYFCTSDFVKYLEVSKVYPEKEFNWLVSELHYFNTLDGRREKGILYKPKSFDSSCKYPVIIHYYEQKSQSLNKYMKPNENSGQLNIPWFTSHGYIVFVPDIQYQIGYPGPSSLNAIGGAANYLTHFNWVGKLGLQGHSFGAYETNYVICHSKQFAAAVSSSGISDLVSFYGNIELPGGGQSHQFQLETSQLRIGAPFWERPDLYIINSPIFSAHKINTPLLMVANKNDGRVPFIQGLELFTLLRRMGKKAWLLQYDNGDHGLFNEIDQLDYLRRTTQFFDHYLKGVAAPVWMTKGVQANIKGNTNGFELDYDVKTPEAGLINEDEQRKLTERRPLSIRLE